MTDCPRCGAAGDEPCTYTVPRSPYYPEEELRRWASLAPQFARADARTPTKRWHADRQAKVNRAERAARAEQQRRAQLRHAAEQRRTHPAARIWDAQRAWEREEQRQLVAWLTHHVDLLIGD